MFSAPWNETAMTLLERELAKKLADREAAIARVREVCDRELINASHRMMSPVRLGYRDALRNILRALDGGAE